jgi:hypothetical protein
MVPLRLLLLAALMVVILPRPLAAASLDGEIRDACVLVTAQVRKAGLGMASATATGFFVAPGLVLTCHHMSRIPTPLGESPTTDYFVDTRSHGRMPAQVVARDARNDLLLLRVAKPAVIEPLPVEPFDLQAGDRVTIIGHFPDCYRISQGSLTHDQVMPGFAMSSAKVRQGYSGGPVLDAGGRVQGILSQKDPWDNAVFAKSDAILALLARVGAKTASAPAELGDPAATRLSASTRADREPAPFDSAQPLPRRNARPTAVGKADSPARKAAAKTTVQARSAGEEEMVVAVPVRRRSSAQTP